jgi:D-serine deaminase-like pyridoxal phosphate-dependent protein
MARLGQNAGISLRPHAKTHKSVDIARRQIDVGAIGICCATLNEAEALAEAEIPGLLLTSPTMGADTADRIGKLNREHGLLAVVDHPRQVEMLSAAIQPGDPALHLLVDVDVGQRRTGVRSLDDGVRLARMIARQRQLRFAGVQGFAGNAQHIADARNRKASACEAADVLQGLKNSLAEEGLAPGIVSGSGTGTCDVDASRPYTELQVGSYVFMDADYAVVRDETGGPLQFEPSLFVLATVVSTNCLGEITVDAGTKALATNGPPPAIVVGVAAGAHYRFAGDEHGIVSIPDGQRAPTLESRILFGATHCDPTVNLHKCYHVVSRNAVLLWPIRGRYGD